jgi:S-DNA-T family DNA segregation ATPase FtsK/SpoIIIE
VNRFDQILDDLDVERHQQFWNALQEELEFRERFQRDCQRKSSIDSTKPPKRLLLVVDELSAVLKSSPKASETLVNLATRGRSLGITLIVTNQGLSGIPRELLLNLRTRIALQSTDQVELVQLGGGSQRILSAQPGWVSARVLRNDRAETDFKFPIGA